MPHTKSAWKRLRQSEKRRQRNRTTIKGIKKQTRVLTDALQGGDAGKAATELVSTAKQLDKAAARGVIHPNKAARLKSRLARKINATRASKPAG
jgi:small subunit ribosomal protein S20